MLITKTVKVKWAGVNKRRYVGLGYAFTKIGDVVEVKTEDLSPNSHAIVEVKCDYCGKVVEKSFQTYNAQHHAEFGDACANCQPQKNKLVCMDKYGVDNGSKTPQAIDKIKNTCMDKYGVDNPAKSKIARKKISEKSKANYKERYAKAKATNMERYGCEYPSQNDDVKAKQRATMIERYGVDHPKKSTEILEREKQRNRDKYGCDYYWQTEECKAQIRQTNMEKYGYEHTLQCPAIRQKGYETMLRNNTCPTSKQQVFVYDMCRNIYGEENVHLNYPLSTLLLDVRLTYKDTLIDIEYDGAYWHQDEQRDRRRDEVVKSFGYKVLRIVGGKEVPTQEQLVNAIEKLVDTHYTFTSINLNV